MGLISELKKKAKEKAAAPKLIIDSDNEHRLQQGEVIITRDTETGIQYSVRIDRDKIGTAISKDDLIIEQVRINS